MFDRLKRWQRERILRRHPVPDHLWRESLALVPMASRLGATDQARLRVGAGHGRANFFSDASSDFGQPRAARRASAARSADKRSRSYVSWSTYDSALANARWPDLPIESGTAVR